MPTKQTDSLDQDLRFVTLEQLFTAEAYKSATFGPAHWREDETGYTVLVAAATNSKHKELHQYDTATGDSQVLLSLEQLPLESDGQPIKIDNYAWSEDQQQLVLFTNTQRVWRINTRGDYWVWHSGQNRWHNLGGDAPPASLMFAKFSPDGRAVAYVRDNNLYVERLDKGAITPLTTDGSPTRINGTSDWVYEEEFERAFRELVHRFQGRIGGLIRRVLNDSGSVDDLTQEVFVRVFLHRRNYRRGSKFSTWAFTIAANLAKNEIRRRVRRRNWF